MFVTAAVIAALQATPAAAPTPHWDGEDRRAVVSAFEPCLRFMFSSLEQFEQPAGWTLIGHGFYDRPRPDGERYALNFEVRPDYYGVDRVRCDVDVPFGDLEVARAYFAGFQVPGLTRTALQSNTAPEVSGWAFRRDGEADPVLKLHLWDRRGDPKIHISFSGPRDRMNFDFDHPISAALAALPR